MPRMVSLQRMIKETVCVAKEGDRETKKTGIDDILVDYCHDWKCFQELWNYLYGDLPLSPEPSISIRESCRIQPVLNYCCGQVGENLKHYLLSLTLFINYMLDRQGSKLLKKKRKPDQYKRRSLGRSTKLWHLPQRSGDPGTPSRTIWEMRNKGAKIQKTCTLGKRTSPGADGTRRSWTTLEANIAKLSWGLEAPVRGGCGGERDNKASR